MGRPAGPRTLLLLPGRNATVSVEERPVEASANVLSLRVNGKVEASTAPLDMRLLRLLGLVPDLLHGEVRTALVIGLGTGMTAGSLLDLPALERLTVFEIEAGVPHAARLFSPWNGALLDDPRVQVAIVTAAARRAPSWHGSGPSGSGSSCRSPASGSTG